MKHDFPKGFAILDNTVVQDPELSLKEKGMYAFLISYCDNVTRSTTISVNRIAAECNVSVSTAKRLLDILIEHNVIRRTRRKKHESWVTTLLK